jgi:hypothetical protein
VTDSEVEHLDTELLVGLFDLTRDAILRADEVLTELRAERAEFARDFKIMREAVARRERVGSDVNVSLSRIQDLTRRAQVDLDQAVTATASLGTALQVHFERANERPDVTKTIRLLSDTYGVARDVRIAAARTNAIRRLASAVKQTSDAERALSDARYADMSSEVVKWWSTLRPDELVSFAGVQRRASGRLYVTLVAAMRSAANADPVNRDAVGVFSDSQMNALGLAAFIARQSLLRSPVIVLDDPLPGYDPEHRLTFVRSTLSSLLDGGVQVVLCTHDPKLASHAVEAHGHRGIRAYDITLADPVSGTQLTNIGDAFGRMCLEAQDYIASLTPAGRKNAASSLRSAAERLAKQIIAAGSTNAGVPTRVSDLDGKVLGDLVPIVLGFALAPDERGRWSLWRRELNPGNHDDEVPASATLKLILADLRKLRKDHAAHWPGGLPE